MAGTVTFLQYFQRVQSRAGQTRSSAIPSVPSPEEQLVLDAINNRLQYLNQKYYLIFRLREATFTATAGTQNYDFTQAPYSFPFFRVNRLAQNAIRRTVDNWPLQYVEYAEADGRAYSGTSGAKAYSVFGNTVRLYPPPIAEQYAVRYYSTAIGTDTTGNTLKDTLTVGSDLTMLEDEYQHVLITLAAKTARAHYGVDAKYTELAKEAEEWEKILADMGNQNGEESGPEFYKQSYVYRGSGALAQYPPFGTWRP